MYSCHALAGQLFVAPGSTLLPVAMVEAGKGLLDLLGSAVASFPWIWQSAHLSSLYSANHCLPVAHLAGFVAVVVPHLAGRCASELETSDAAVLAAMPVLWLAGQA